MNTSTRDHPDRPAPGRTRLARRRFLARAAATLAVPCVVPGAVLGKDGAEPASQRITIGVIGNVADVALRLNRKVRWDPAHDQFMGDDQANRLLSRAMRQPWTM